MKPQANPETLTMPSLDTWLREAQAEENADRCGMYLFHTGVVRGTEKKVVRSPEYQPETSEKDSTVIQTEKDSLPLKASDSAVPAHVSGMQFSYDPEKVEAAIRSARQLPGIYFVRVWMNEGLLSVGDPLMLVLVGGDIRPRVIAALESLVEELKTACVTETEIK